MTCLATGRTHLATGRANDLKIVYQWCHWNASSFSISSTLRVDTKLKKWIKHWKPKGVIIVGHRDIIIRTTLLQTNIFIDCRYQILCYWNNGCIAWNFRTHFKIIVVCESAVTTSGRKTIKKGVFGEDGRCIFIRIAQLTKDAVPSVFAFSSTGQGSCDLPVASCELSQERKRDADCLPADHSKKRQRQNCIAEVRVIL